MIRKIGLFFTGFLFLSAVLLYSVPLRGAWLDSFFSSWVSEAAGIPVQAKKIVLTKFSSCSFGELDYASAEQEPLVRALNGELNWEARQLLLGQRAHAWLSVQDAVLTKALLKRFPIGSLTLDKFSEDSLRISNLKFWGLREGAHQKVRILKWSSNELILRGGLNFKNEQLQTLHLVLQVSDRFFEELPRQVRSRMISRPGGWREVKIIYHQKSLTVLGKMGPFFQFQWQ